MRKCTCIYKMIFGNNRTMVILNWNDYNTRARVYAPIAQLDRATAF